MWMFTEFGFYSIVADRRKKNSMLVRARERRDLENFGAVMGWPKDITQEAIIETKGSDYQFRLVLDRSTVALFQQRVIEGVTYHNFKGRIAEKPDQRHKSTALHKVWDAMAALQPCRPYSTKPRAEEDKAEKGQWESVDDKREKDFQLF